MSSDLHDLARRVAHDLGKYATLQARWLPPKASFQERVEAGEADLLRTASGGDGVRGAAQLALAFLAELREGGWGDPAALQLRAALEDLLEAVAPFAGLGATPVDTPENRQVVDDALAAAGRVRAAAKQLVASTRPPEPFDVSP